MLWGRNTSTHTSKVPTAVGHSMLSNLVHHLTIGAVGQGTMQAAKSVSLLLVDQLHSRCRLELQPYKLYKCHHLDILHIALRALQCSG